MRRTLVGEGDRPFLTGFAFRLPLKQHADATLKAFNLAFLARDDGRQIVRQPRQMRDVFLKPLNPVVLVHKASIR